MLIRPVRRSDQAAVDGLLRAAFEGPDEADLVRALRGCPEYVPALELMAERMGEVVGHLMFTTADVVGRPREIPVLALAPVAVAPSHQRRGVGTELMDLGLDLARARGDVAVIVVGDPAYYTRFGFKPASRFGVRVPFEAPDEAVMALELQPGVLEGQIGVVRYAAPFDALT